MSTTVCHRVIIVCRTYSVRYHVRANNYNVSYYRYRSATIQSPSSDCIDERYRTLLLNGYESLVTGKGIVNLKIK